MSGQWFVLLTFLVVTVPGWILLAIVPKRHPWKALRVAAWTWITVLGFFGMNYFLVACQNAVTP